MPVSEPVFTVTGPYDRFETYTWINGQDIPLVQYTNSLYRPHNCLTSEIPMLWDFLEHYRCGAGRRRRCDRPLLQCLRLRTGRSGPDQFGA